MARVETLIRMGLPSTIARTVWMFGLNLRFGDAGDIQTNASLILGTATVMDLTAR